MICTNNVIHFYSRCLLIFFVVFPVNSCFSVFLVCQKVVMSRCMSFLVLRALFLHILCIRLDFNQLFNKNSRILQNSFKNIWSIRQKYIPLHPLSGTKYWSNKKEFFEQDYIKDREVVQWARFPSFFKEWESEVNEPSNLLDVRCFLNREIRRSWTETNSSAADSLE